jgi:polysaccharide export outer membrane protein
MSRLSTVLALGFALFAAAPGAIQAQSPAAGPDGGLQPGDIVEVTVWQREELSGNFTVAPDGSLSHPLYRQVRVTGIPVNQVEDRVRTFLSAYESNPQIIVQPLYHVAISGPVMRPDIYNLPPGTTLSQAITRAGGVLDAGDREEVLLIRNGQETELNLTEADDMLMALQSGDQIIVTTDSGLGGFRSVILPVIQIATSVAHLIYLAGR